MQFRMYESGLHYYDTYEYFTFVTTVVYNKKLYSRLRIKSSDRTSDIYGNVTYTSVAYYIWSIQKHQIK